MQPRIAAQRFLHQFRMRALLDDFAVVEHDDAGGVAHGADPVGDDDHRAALRDGTHFVLDHPFAFVVQRRRRFVEDQDTRVGQQRSGDGAALALPA